MDCNVSNILFTDGLHDGDMYLPYTQGVPSAIVIIYYARTLPSKVYKRITINTLWGKV